MERVNGGLRRVGHGGERRVSYEGCGGWIMGAAEGEDRYVTRGCVGGGGLSGHHVTMAGSRKGIGPIRGR